MEWERGKLNKTDMGAKYVMQEMNDLNRPGERVLYPRMVSMGCCDTERLIRETMRNTTYGPGEVRGMLALLARGMASMMAEGYSVKLDGIGVFSPSLSLREGKEREQVDGDGTKRNASSIRVGGVKFRADKRLVNDVDLRCSLSRERGKTVRGGSPYPPERRLEMALRFLDSNRFLTVGDYSALTGLGRTTASVELRRWSETPGSGIAGSGQGSHRVYVRREE